MSLDSHVVSLRTLFDPERSHGFAARIALNLGEDRALPAARARGRRRLSRPRYPAPQASSP